jgi:hypothetical protein
MELVVLIMEMLKPTTWTTEKAPWKLSTLAWALGTIPVLGKDHGFCQVRKYPWFFTLRIQ